jgi:Glyoxalase/Bleomycin resistance protein/Dioxygenase superfamily
MAPRDLFHVMQIVEDFDDAHERWQALVAPDDYHAKSWSDFDKRWASLAYVGPDFVLEIMEPSPAEEDAGYPLPKFRRRFGQHWHSFAWFVEADDFAGLLERFWAHGVRVAGPRGLLEEGSLDALPQTMFTHPRDTGGQIEFQSRTAAGGFGVHERRPATWWRHEHPLGIVRLSHLTTGSADLERSKALWTGPIGGTCFLERSDATVDAAFVLVGDETVVELAQPATSGTRLAEDLAKHGELPHAVTFEVVDLDRAERHIEAIGMRVADRHGESVTIEPADLCGAVVHFSAAGVPDDPRGPAAGASVTGAQQ